MIITKSILHLRGHPAFRLPVSLNSLRDWTPFRSPAANVTRLIFRGRTSESGHNPFCGFHNIFDRKTISFKHRIGGARGTEGGHTDKLTVCAEISFPSQSD